MHLTSKEFSVMGDKFEKHRLLAWKIPPILQSTPDTCWAACMEWWAKATCGGRPQLTQDQIYFKYARLANENNRISRASLAQILNEPIWKAKTESITNWRNVGLNYFYKRLESGPMLIGYHDAVHGNDHVNVIIAPSITYRNEFIVMEPARGITTHKGYGKYTSVSSALFTAWPNC